MAWKRGQKTTFVLACKAIGYGEDQRHAILSAFPHAICGKGHPSSTSKRLNNSDFENVMAIVESVTPGCRVKGFAALYFAGQSNIDGGRMQRRINKMADRLVDAGRLEPNGVGLAGWIKKEITPGIDTRLDQLDYTQRYNLIEGLKAYARRNGVRLDK